MRTLSLRRVFPGILAWDSFFHLNHDDQRRMFSIFRAHVAPRTAVWTNAVVEARFNFYKQVCSRRSHRAAGRGTALPREFEPTEYKHLLDSHRFDAVVTVPEDQSCGGRTVWLAQLC
jgi:hypothetical protein